jgi:predicted ferric reductase
MKFSIKQFFLWLTIYIAIAIIPLFIAYLGKPSGSRSFWVEFSVGLGFVGFALMWLQFVLTGRFKSVASSLGLDSMLQFHRHSGLVAFLFILAHPLILFVSHPIYLDYLNPYSNLPRAFALSAVIAALLLLIGTTLWRKEIGLSYEWWRAGHGVLALFVVFIGLVHILQVGFYISTPWKQALWILTTAGATLLLVKTRVIRPLLLRRKPYRVSEVRKERGDSYTLVLTAEGHPGMKFVAGQFVWLTLGNSPFSLQQHPFSISSSSHRTDQIELTIKELGDFTGTIKTVETGTRAFLEGPFGAFTLEAASSKGAVFIVGGVGITPVISILRTLREAKDPRSLRLIYGSRNWEETLFREEIEILRQNLNLQVIHVLQEPHESWDGESGLINKPIIDRYLPSDLTDHEYYVCGPAPMMDLVEVYLRQCGVPLRQIFSERFNIV